MSQVLNINSSTVVTHKSQKHNRVNVMKKKEDYTSINYLS